jgi:hypothetical protein
MIRYILKIEPKRKRLNPIRRRQIENEEIIPQCRFYRSKIQVSRPLWECDPQDRLTRTTDAHVSLRYGVSVRNYFQVLPEFL